MSQETKNSIHDQWHPATRMVHAGSNRSQHGETSEALYLTQGFVYDSAEQAEARFAGDEPGFIYSRYANPTVAMFEERLAALEGAEVCLATASGMSAVTAALMCQLKAGDHIVAARALFGSCRWVVEKLAPRFGIACTLVDGRDLKAWQEAIRPETKVLFLESPTNPTLELVDIAAVAKIAHATDARLVVDNVFATPMFQRPLELGADVVVYSATKHIDGQGRCLGGAILGRADWVDEELWDFYRHTGPSLSPFNAWVLLKGLETLPVRVAQQARSAAAIADHLTQSAACSRVIYPGRADHPQADVALSQMSGGSTLIAFELSGGKDIAFRFENALQLIRLSNNLGDAKSLITHPATTTHKNLSETDRQELGITDGMVRLSVGLEDERDLMADIDRALATI